MNNKEKILQKESIWKLLTRMSLPAMGAYLINALYNVVDAGFIANQINGMNGLAAITAVLPIYMLIIGISSMFGVGGAALYSRFLGEGEKDKANIIIGNVIILSFIVGVLITVFGLIYTEQLCLFFGASENILENSASYLQILLYGCIFMQLGISITNLIRGEGNAIIAMLSMIIGSVINILLDYLFIVKMNKGIEGAATATVIGNIVSFIFMLIYLFSKNCTFDIKIKIFRLRYKYVKEIIICGFPSFLIQLLSIIFMTEFNIIIKGMNKSSYLAVAGVIIRITNFFNLPMLGIMNGVIPIIGYNYGAKLYTRVIDTIKKASIFSTVICVVSFVIIMIFARSIVEIFISADEEVFELAVIGLRIVTFLLTTAGIQMISTGIFQSLGKTKEAAISIMVRNILLIILLGIFSKSFGFIGIMYAFPITDFLGFIVIIRLLKISKKEICSLNSIQQKKIKIEPYKKRAIRAVNN